MGSVEACGRFPEFVVLVGPMYSGKTSELQRLIYKSKNQGKRCLVVNHKSDTERQREEFPDQYDIGRERTSARLSVVVSHSGHSYEALMASSLMNEVYGKKEYEEADVIGIDEAQFFASGDLIQFVSVSRYVHKKDIIVVGLHADSEKSNFMNMNFLVVHATKFKLLSANCHHPGCFNKAHQTFAAFEKKDRIAVGVKNYMPLCDFHYEHYKTVSSAGIGSNDYEDGSAVHAGDE